MSAESTSDAAANILVVDDTPANLTLLTSLFQKSGYKVRPVPSGGLALQAAAMDKPDLILLDINMPMMDGYEVCRRLKENPALAAVPVVFISALDDTVDKLRGFALGAVDYVTKPFDFAEVEARVQTHLEMARLRRELERHNARLEEKVAQRTRELAEANSRLAILDQAKTDFLSLISHEVRTPLNGIFCISELLLESCIDEKSTGEYREMYQQSRRRLMTLIDDALLLSQIGVGADIGAQQECMLEGILLHAWAEAESFASYRKVRLAALPRDLGPVLGSVEYLEHAVQSLLETAVKFANADTTVRFFTKATPGEIDLILEADGRTVPPKELPHFFDLLAIAEPITPGGDLGFALPLAERIVTLYGGTVAVENISPPGIRLTVHLKTPESNSI